ncbi:nuclear pore complex protein Nup205-like [Uranotaenia lowii]|uniref:nuclear pore complex protein Nup205-like n=1 Tax=Uranotaenia lowii TaxID=190385 RepID=UPI0024790949|nr:nuclear pore complex protein Nup205-like [Uranotaenia lowii]
MLGLLTQNERTKIEIRQGLCLESEASVTFSEDDVECGQELQEQQHETGSVCLELQYKKAIVDRLRGVCGSRAPPNLAHHLLGFDLSKELLLTNLQQPGVLPDQLQLILPLEEGQLNSPAQELVIEHG